MSKETTPEIVVNGVDAETFEIVREEIREKTGIRADRVQFGQSDEGEL